MASDLATGLAAEHLVCADLLLDGHRAFLAAQTCPYDVVVEVGGSIVRLQVKSTRQPRELANRSAESATYYFNVRRAGKAGRRTYGSEEFDALALVALDIRRIAYVPIRGVQQSVSVRVPGAKYSPRSGPGRTFDANSFASLVEALQ